MAGTVLFTGAGVSKAYGLPLTREIMPMICERLNSEDLFGRGQQAETRHQLLHGYLRRLFPGLDRLIAETGDDVSLYPPVTDALSLADHLISGDNALGKDIGAAELSEFRGLMEHAIMRTLGLSDESHRQSSDRDKLVSRFTTWAFRAAVPFSVVSTNYDTICDFALLQKVRALGQTTNVDFGMSWRSVSTGSIVHRPLTPSLSILKLHGSLNWLHCPACDAIYINRQSNIHALGFRDKITDANTCHCDYAPLRPVLVAPSFAREIRNANVFSVWQGALEALRNAKSWILAGYSLPPEDYAIRAILQRAYHGRTHENLNVTVVQHGQDPATEWRYRLLFPDCTFVSTGFARFLAEGSA